MTDCSSNMARLAVAATDAASRAHAPYSRFPVGAAVLTKSGSVYTGCNVENASFSLTQCAERTALTSAIADGVAPGEMDMLAIFTPDDQVHAPCGACRQVMVELMAPGSTIESCCATGASRRWTLDELQPQPFTRQSLLSSSGFGKED